MQTYTEVYYIACVWICSNLANVLQIKFLYLSDYRYLAYMDRFRKFLLKQDISESEIEIFARNLSTPNVIQKEGMNVLKHLV